MKLLMGIVLLLASIFIIVLLAFAIIGSIVGAQWMDFDYKHRDDD